MKWVRVATGSGHAVIIAPGEWELNQRPGERPIVPRCNGNCEILLRERLRAAPHQGFHCGAGGRRNDVWAG